MKKIIEIAVLFMVLFCVKTGYGQSEKSPYNHLDFKSIDRSSAKVDIQCLDIKSNRFLFNEISIFLKEQNDSSYFKKYNFGYIVVHSYKTYNRKLVTADDLIHHLKDTVSTFIIGTSTLLLSLQDSPEFFCGNCFPAFYSIIDERLILFKDDYTSWITSNNYSLNSKKIIVDLVKKSLQKALDPNFTFIGIENNTPYKLSLEARKNLNEDQILEKALFFKTLSKKVILHYDNSISYEYK